MSSKLYELLQGVIQKVNKSVSTDAQQLTEEQKLQVKTNLGISDTTASAIPDWNQNDETAPDYVKNRTHYRIDVADTDKPVLSLSVNLAEVLEVIEVDGVQTWAQQKFVLPVTEHIGRLYDYEFDPNDQSAGKDDPELRKYLYIRHNFNYKSEYEEVRVEPAWIYHNNSEYLFASDAQQIVIDTPAFTITGPYSYEAPAAPGEDPVSVVENNWYIEPKIAPYSGLEQTYTYISIFRGRYDFSQLDARYIPTSGVAEYLKDSQYPVSVAGVIKALRSDVDYFNLRNTPCYNRPEVADLICSATITPTSGAHISCKLKYDNEYYKVVVNGENLGVFRNSFDHPHLSGFYIGNLSLGYEDCPDTGELVLIEYADMDRLDYSRVWLSDKYSTQDQVYIELYEVVPEDHKRLEESLLPDSQVTSDEIQQLADMIK
jgi:hypothetical protein